MCKFPAINIYSSPRVTQQKVNNAKVPLLKYREKVSANNRTKNYESDHVDKSLLRKLDQKDGLIFNMKDMKKPVEEYMRKEIDYFMNDGKILNSEEH